MNIGKMRHKIIFQKDINKGIDPPVLDDNDNAIPNWQLFKTKWSYKQGLSGSTFYAAAAVQAENDCIFKIRYDNQITEDLQIVDDAGIYTIKSIVDKEGTKMYLTITASIIVKG